MSTAIYGICERPLKKSLGSQRIGPVVNCNNKMPLNFISGLIVKFVSELNGRFLL